MKEMKQNRRGSRASNKTRLASRVRVSNSLHGEAAKNQTSSFCNGDLVWAKAFPYTWWPGRITKTKGSTASVSFFGCNLSRTFRVSEIHGFEENYGWISRMVCVERSEDINLALEELSRREFLALICPCRNLSIDRIGAKAKEGFEPREMLKFVLKKALSVCYGDDEVISTARSSAQVNAYRNYVYVCCDTEEKEGYRADDVDVTSRIDEEKTDCFSTTMDQCNAGLAQEALETTSENAMIHGVSSEPDVDISVEVLEDQVHEGINICIDISVEVSEDQVHEGIDICIINREDFSILDLDVEYEPLLENQPHASRNENTRKQNIENKIIQQPDKQATSDSTEQLLPPSEKDNLPIHLSNISGKHSPDEKLKHFKLQPNTEDILVAVSEKANEEGTVNIGPYSDNLEREIIQADEETYTVENEIDNSTKLLLVYASEETSNVKHEIDNFDEQSPEEKLKHCIEFLPNHEDRLIPDNEKTNKNETTNIVSGLSLSPKKLSGSFQKRSRDETNQTVTCNKSKLQKVLMTPSKATSHASRTIEGQSSMSNAVPKEANADIDVVKSHSGGNSGIAPHQKNQKSDGLPLSASKDTQLQKKRLDQSIPSRPSNWHKFYASPLVSTNPMLTREAQKPSPDSCIFAKSLHMKFPKNFELPSKEEIERRFRVFGPLNGSKTRLFFYTGSGSVEFVHHSDAYAAYKFVKRKNIFGQANVRFWLDRYKSFRKGRDIGDSSVPPIEHLSSNLQSCEKMLSAPITHHSPPNLSTADLSSSMRKPCLKRPNALSGWGTEKIRKVRFLMET